MARVTTIQNCVRTLAILAALTHQPCKSSMFYGKHIFEDHIVSWLMYGEAMSSKYPSCGWTVELTSVYNMSIVTVDQNVNVVKLSNHKFVLGGVGDTLDLNPILSTAPQGYHTAVIFGGPFPLDVRFWDIARGVFTCRCPWTAQECPMPVVTTPAPTTTTTAPTTTTTTTTITTTAAPTTTTSTTTTTPTTTITPTTTTTTQPTTTTTPATTTTATTTAPTTTTTQPTTTTATTTTIGVTTPQPTTTTPTTERTTTTSKSTTTKLPESITTTPPSNGVIGTNITSLPTAQSTTSSPTLPTTTTTTMTTTTAARMTTEPTSYAGYDVRDPTRIYLQNRPGTCYTNSVKSTLPRHTNIKECLFKCVPERSCVGVNVWRDRGRCDLVSDEEVDDNLGPAQAGCQFYRVLWKA